MTIMRDSCPLCGGRVFVEDSVAKPNLYSEKLASILDKDEELLLDQHSNWRCLTCGLIFKRRWFDESVIRELFTHAVPTHPKGWDAVLKRFSAGGFERAMTEWALGCERSVVPDIRRGERELLSILDSIQPPVQFDSLAAEAAIKARDVASLRALSPAVTTSIAEPVPFKRFAAFRSRSLWDYLQDRTGGLNAYAEIGCPLWGLLKLSADSGVEATFLERAEPNYWGAGCVDSGDHCITRLLRDESIARSDWSTPSRYSLIGLFQYLDHISEPREFLRFIFDKADSIAVVLDGIDSPVAIQHTTGWTESAMAFVADLFGKRLHTDFDEIRPSGNVLYLLAAVSK